MDATMEYTRGGVDQPDNRGKTMVALHNERLRQQKEVTAMKIVRALVPDLTTAVCKAALEHCQLDGMQAAHLLQDFKRANATELQALHKTYAPATAAGDASGSDSDASSSDSDRRRSKKSSSKHRKSKNKEKDKKKKKKSSSSSKKRKRDDDKPAQASFGKYGVLKESDFDAKRGDFVVWAMEVAKVDPETLPKHEERELFKTYVEDFNTATLPHKKYYDVAAYEAKQRAKASKKQTADGGERSRFDDEAELRREVAERRAREQQERLQQAYAELVHTDKAADMREQQLLRAEMALAYRTGDHARAEKLALRLAPDQVQEKKKEEKKAALGLDQGEGY